MNDLEVISLACELEASWSYNTSGNEQMNELYKVTT